MSNEQALGLMSNAATTDKANRIFTAAFGTMERLYGRWQDEKQHEDIRDYGASVAPHVDAEGGRFLEMSKKPFGFTFEVDGLTYSATINARNYVLNRRSANPTSAPAPTPGM
jgi:hypothetical protein